MHCKALAESVRHCLIGCLQKVLACRLEVGPNSKLENGLQYTVDHDKSVTQRFLGKSLFEQPIIEESGTSRNLDCGLLRVCQCRP